MEISIINKFETFEQLRENWDAVYQSDTKAQFFLSWIWLSSWFKCKKPSSWLILAAKPENSSSYVSFFPLSLNKISRNGLTLFQELCMGGNYIADYTGLICVPDYEEISISAFSDYCQKNLEWDFLHLENVLDERLEAFLKYLPEQSFNIGKIQQNISQDNIDSSCCAYIKLPKTWDEYLHDLLSSNTRQKLKRFLRKFESSESLKITHIEEHNLEQQIEIFLKLWQLHWGKQNEEMLNFLRKLFHCSLENESLYLPILWHEDTPIAGIVNFLDRTKKTVSFFITGRQDGFLNPPPGILLHAIGIQYAIENGFEIYDFLRGDESYKFHFGAKARYLKNTIVSRNGFFNRLQHNLSQGNTIEYNRQYLNRPVIIFSPHQDDETLGCGGMIVHKKKAGADVKIIFMTDGSQSHSHLISPDKLKKLREEEAISAAQKLGVPQEDVFFLEFPDGNLKSHRAVAEHKVLEIINYYQPQEIFLPYYLDGVPDHDVTNQIVTSALMKSEKKVTVYEYPIWFWSKCPWLKLKEDQINNQSVYKQFLSSKFSLELFENFCCSIYVGDVLDLKKAALNEHKSQVTRLDFDSTWTTLGDVLEGKFLNCFFQNYEYFRQYPSSALPDINALKQNQVAAKPTDLVKALQMAMKYQKANSFAKAEKIYRQILKQQPNQPDTLHGLSLLAQRTGQYQEAEQLLKTMLQSQPKSFKAWFSLGNLYQCQGQLDDAVISYQQAIELKPNAFAIYNNLGYVFEQQGQLDKALVCYQKAIDIQPNCTEASASLGNILFAQEKLSLEQQIYYAALNNDLGFNCQNKNNLDNAITYYRHAIALQPNLTIAHYNLGVVLDMKGALEEARACYQTVVNLNTSSFHSRLASQRLGKIDQLFQQQRQSSITKKLKVAFICQPFVMTDFRNPMDSIGIITDELVRRLALECDVTVYGASAQTREDYYEGVAYQYISVTEDIQLLKQFEQSQSPRAANKPLFASDTYYQKYINTIANEVSHQGFDIVHIHNLSQFVPAIRALNPDAKIVLHMHCDWLSNLDYSMLCERLQYADLIISPSECITEGISQRFPEYSSRCQTVFNGVNVHRFLNGYINQSLQGSKQSKSVKRLLFVGRVCPEKGSHILLEAFQKVITQYPDVELTLVGPIGVIPFEFHVALSDDPKIQALASFHIEGAWMNYLKKSLSQLNSQKAPKGASKAFLPGVVSPSLLAQYYHQADIFIFPSVFHEAFGMPIAEAMVAGLPVIATQAGAIPELVESGKSGLLVERSNASALAKAILKLLRDDDLRKSMGRAGCERAVELFSFDKVVIDLLDQYKYVCSVKPT